MTDKLEGGISAVSRDEKILGLLGLAAKAGKLIAGADKIVDAARLGALASHGGLILIARDASARTKKNLQLAADESGTRYVCISADMAGLGRRTGGKGSASAVAVTDRHLASALAGLAEQGADK